MPTPTMRQPEHFEWLVRYQVEGRSYNWLAGHYHQHKGTIEDAVKDKAALIGLRLRPPGRPGRPPRS